MTPEEIAAYVEAHPERVGSVGGGPRPEVGARVLVLGCLRDDPDHLGYVGPVVDFDREHGYAEVGPNAAGCIATRWALLPPAAEPDVVSPEDRGTDALTAGDIAMAQAAVAHVDTGSPHVPLLATDPEPTDAVVERISRAAAADHRGPCVPLPGTVVDPSEPPPDVAADIRRAAAAIERNPREPYTPPTDPESTDAVEGPPARPYVPVPDPVLTGAATRFGQPVTSIVGDYVCWDSGRCNCATGPNGEHEPHCGLEPLVHVAELRALGFVRVGPPARPWRVGTSWGVTLVEQGTGTPDKHGRRRDDRLVGMCRDEADAARIVDAVNGGRSAHARGQEIADRRDEARRFARYLERCNTTLTGERDGAQAEVERLRGLVRRLADAIEGMPIKGYWSEDPGVREAADAVTAARAALDGGS